MSWDVDIQNHKDETVILTETHHIRGGTYPVGGTTEASLNITYNYSKYYAEFFEDSLWDLQGKDVKATVPTLERIVAALGTETTDDYWQGTAGNAGRAVEQLLHLCRLALHEYPHEPLHFLIT